MQNTIHWCKHCLVYIVINRFLSNRNLTFFQEERETSNDRRHVRYYICRCFSGFHASIDSHTLCKTESLQTNNCFHNGFHSNKHKYKSITQIINLFVPGYKYIRSGVTCTAGSGSGCSFDLNAIRKRFGPRNYVCSHPFLSHPPLTPTHSQTRQIAKLGLTMSTHCSRGWGAKQVFSSQKL